MAEFTDSQIDEAKERVRQMHSRATSYISSEEKRAEPAAKVENQVPTPPPDESHANQSQSQNQNQHSSPMSSLPFNLSNMIGSITPNSSNKTDEEKDEATMILMIIMLLSHENADSKLILALLYLIF